MWEVLVRTPLGTVSKRKFVMLIATFIVAVLGYLFATPTDVYAADAQWNNDAISYDAKDFTGPFTAEDNDKSSLPKDTIYYATYDTASPSSGAEQKGYIIYFPKNTQPEKATTAFYSEGEYNPSTGRFSNLSPPKQISLDAETYSSTAASSVESCSVDGIGWIVCPVSKWIAQGMDLMYGFIESYLFVTPLSDGNNGIYQMWNIVRNLANVAFIIGFLILIYAQITGNIVSSYNLKKILPRVIVAAILVNTSYWICAVGVDASNIVGASIQQLFMNMFDQLGDANSAAADIGWEKATALALGGGSLAAVGLLSATSGGAGAFAFLIIGALVPALFAVFVAIVILAGRQALITVLIIVSPLAFVAYLLPNTEDWFNRWRKFFLSLLIMFPAFAVVFGGSQLAGKLIIQNATNLSVVILGLVVQVIPLFVAPLLIRLSSGLLSTIAGITNDKSKGVFDNAKNWAKGNQDLHRARAINRGLRPNSQTNGIRPLTSLGARVAMGTKNRENRTQALMSGAEGLYASRTRSGRRTARTQSINKEYQSFADSRNAERYEDYLDGNNLGGGAARLPLVGNRVHARRQDQAAALRHTTHAAHEAHANAEALKGLRDAESEAHYQATLEGAAIGDGTRAGQIRQARVDAINLTGQSEVSKGVIEKQGQELLKRTIANSGNLSRQVTLSYQFEKDAEKYNTIVQEAAKEAYEIRTVADQAARTLHLNVENQSRAAKVAEERTVSMIANVEAMGANAPGLSTLDSAAADAIRNSAHELVYEASRKNNAETQKQANITDELLSNTRVVQGQAVRDYAGGVRGNAGAESVLANAIASYRKDYNEKISEKDQLMKHFNLSSSERQTVALGSAPVTVTRGGATYVFDPADEFAREAAIEKQLKAGSYGDIENIIMQSGVGGQTYEYRTTISDAIVANGLQNKALFFGSKTIDDVAQGNIVGDQGLYNAALYHIREGKIKDEVLASQSPGALERMFALGANPSLSPDFASLSPVQQATFVERANALRQSAKRILEDEKLRVRADEASLKVFEANRAP